jgi:hypothetical protein
MKLLYVFKERAPIFMELAWRVSLSSASVLMHAMLSLLDRPEQLTPLIGHEHQGQPALQGERQQTARGQPATGPTGGRVSGRTIALSMALFTAWFYSENHELQSVGTSLGEH